jgi:YebC/PmpR family DNA-binding regulatory protein
MAGHSKWSNIKRKKGAVDQKRGKIFTRCIHEITVAAREGGGDPAANARLRFAIDRAKSVNVPNDTIERAIKRATGELIDGEQNFELTYEGYGPGGAAILVEVITNNKNRTVSEVRHAFSRGGGSIGESGCVQWMFEKKGVFIINSDHIDEVSLVELALEIGAEDVSSDDGVWLVTCEIKDFLEIESLLLPRLKLEVAEVQQLPKNKLMINETDSEKLFKLIDALDDLDDVLNVYSNAEVSLE